MIMLKYVAYLVYFVYLMYVRVIMFCREMRGIIFDVKLNKVKSQNKYYFAGYMTHIREFILTKVIAYDETIPCLIKKILLDCLNISIQLAEYEVNVNGRPVRKIIRSGSLYESLNILYTDNVFVRRPKIFNLSVSSIKLIKQNNEQMNLTTDVLKYIGQRNTLQDIIELITMEHLDETTISGYRICFEKVEADLISVKEIVVPLSNYNQAVVDDLINSI
jgi:hypothetical protein